jgi:4-diphosphocytidyl-2-C-methyl-D-erythritol kinase
MSVRVRCPAKLNLHLEVVGRRPDGYHELRTLFAAVGIWDDVEVFEAAGEPTLDVEPPGIVSAGEDNLVLRAARLLRAHARVERGGRILLHKRIPVGGGLGGGSSDGAATLVALDALWCTGLSDADLARLAARLGADAPYFLTAGCGWGTGRGDEVRPLRDLAAHWAVVASGDAPVSTADVYRRHERVGMDARGVAEVYRWVVEGGAPPFEAFRNDLESTVIAGWPEIGTRLRRVRATAPILAQVSGSGGSVYGLFAGESEALRAATALRDIGSVVVAPILTRQQSRLRPLAEGE